MLTSLEIENFRGFKHLKVEGLGRVNLIIGRNDSGKTSFLGAAAFARSPGALESWACKLGHGELSPDDLERVWRPLFFGGQSAEPIRISSVDATGESAQLRVALSAGGRANAPGRFPVLIRLNQGRSEHQMKLFDSKTAAGDIPDGADGLVESGGWWSGPYPDPEDELLDVLTDLYVQGRLARVSEVVRSIQPKLARVELAGNAVYVILQDHALPLPVSVLGDGARRLLEFSAAVASSFAELYIDEIENGFHYSTLPSVWKLFQGAKVNQIFATTHRDENIRVACEVFQAAGDDGLRVIRIDRTEDGHRAVVYTAGMALDAMESDLEIRG